jgi:hypothetical protein
MMGIGARFRYLALNSGPLDGFEISTLQKIYKLKGALIKLEFGAMRVRGALEYVKRKGMGWVQHTRNARCTHAEQFGNSRSRGNIAIFGLY